jgi:ABC-type branched-subunit amino acid transport system substrate-binding protein
VSHSPHRNALVGFILSLLLAAAAHGAGGQGEEIVVGQSVALSGPDADIGRDMRDGALAVFKQVNASNALGHPIRLVTMDNSNDRQRALDNTKRLLEGENAAVLFGYNSATNSLDAAALAAQNDMLFFAPFSGSVKLRASPNVYTIRASYKDEVARIIEAKHSVGADKAVVLYYDDEVGHGNFETVASAFADAGLPKPAGVAVKRGAALPEATVADVLKTQPHYVLATTQYSVVSDLLRIAGKSGQPPSVAALSFVNPDELQDSAGALARGVIVSQVIPTPSASNEIALPVVRECAEALKALNGAKLDYTSLESCIAAKVLVAAIRHAGAKPTREAILHAMASLGRVDLGGYALNFTPPARQGSSWVELTMLSRGNRYVR